jgi:hypothetical protein
MRSKNNTRCIGITMNSLNNELLTEVSEIRQLLHTYFVQGKGSSQKILDAINSIAVLAKLLKDMDEEEQPYYE